jgi:hypothetical protein
MQSRIKVILKKRENKIIIDILLLFFVSFFLISSTIFSKGIIMAGDWSVPATEVQVEKYSEQGMFSWIQIGNLFGMRQSSFASIPFQIAVKLCSVLGIYGGNFNKLLLFFLFSFAGISMYSFLKFLEIRRPMAIFGGIIYITAPVFFDYTIMGWIFVVFVMGLMPLAAMYFIKAVRKNNIRYAFISGIIYALSIIQSQALFWFMIIFILLGFYLIKDKKTFFVYIKNLTIVIALFFLLNSYWILGLILLPDASIKGSNVVNSSISLGTSANLRPLHILRLFGGLANYQYETILGDSKLALLSFLVPILVASSLFIIKKEKKIARITLAFWLIGSVPFFMYLLNFYRGILFYMPFSNVIRDFARFTVLSTFAYAVLIAIVLNFVFLEKDKDKRYKYVLAIIIFLWFFSIFPWWRGELTNWEISANADMRLRSKIFSDEYFSVEKDFYQKKLDQKAFYLPMGGMMDFVNDPKYYGAYREIQDIFASYSPIPGVLAISDRNNGYSDAYIGLIKKQKEGLYENTLLSDVKYFVVRKDMVINDTEILDNLKSAEEKGLILKYFDGKDVLVYSKKEFLPHFYTPKDVILPKRSIDQLSRITVGNGYDVRSAIFYDRYNKMKGKLMKQIKDEIATVAPSTELPRNDNPTLEFKKINPTKYRIRVHNASGVFPLVFSESFHDGWRAYIAPDQNSKLKVQSSLNNYKILDGNNEDQASKNELGDYIKNGWITTLDNNKTGKIDFISKNFQGTIQNDNLPNGSIFETWFKNPIDENNHLMANGYANSWLLDVNKICGNNSEIAMASPRNDIKCVKNADGTYDFEIVVEFWAQRFFYVGSAISGITLLGCIVYLGVGFYKRKKI